MKTLLALFFIFTSVLGDKILTIATYNVENLFDLSKEYRYKEFEANGQSLWNQKNYKIKLNNIAHVIKDINADIIALQEIGSLQALKDLRFTLKKHGLYYQYFSIANKKKTVIKVALLSKFPFVYSKELQVTTSYKYRNILETKFIVDKTPFYVFTNHWKSKSGPESMRIISAKKLLQRVKDIGVHKNIVLLGDFNSDYEEYIRFKKKRRHNDTHGKTGINHVLKSLNTEDSLFYNLWYDEKDKEQRYSYIFKRKKEALDNILVSKSVVQNNNFDYINGSINNFSKPYLFKKKAIYRWQMSHGSILKHKGKGYSDHLPVIAKFKISSK